MLKALMKRMDVFLGTFNCNTQDKKLIPPNQSTAFKAVDWFGGA
jgi:hypothetical protein